MPYFMYVTLQGDDKILTFKMDPDSGKLEPQGELALSGGPAPLSVDPQRRYLYAGRRGSKELSSFSIDQKTAGLTLIGTVPLETDSVYLATDRTGRFLLSAYYEGSMVTVHPIGEDGAVIDFPVQKLPTARGAHSIQTDPSNNFAFVPHIAAGRGPNAVFQFRFDEKTGTLSPNDPPRVSPEEELGPRHFCFHPNGNTVYFSNEQGCSVTAYRFDRTAGTLSAFQTISTLPQGYQGDNTCAQIQISPNGRFLYAPNRGHDSVACFTVDPTTDELTSIGQTPSEAVPRVICVDPQGRFLYAAGIDSGRLASYRINGDTGNLEPLEIYPVGQRPMWVMIIELTG
jgi:6-phosphogluconolactonase